MGNALALSDEIQVYTGDAAAPGGFNLTWHNNYTFDGLKTPDFPVGFADNCSLSGVTKWAYSVTPWFEAELFLPLYAVSRNRCAQFNGFKLRKLFVNPDNATSNFYYGVRVQLQFASLGRWPHARRDTSDPGLSLRQLKPDLQSHSRQFLSWPVAAGFRAGHPPGLHDSQRLVRGDGGI